MKQQQLLPNRWGDAFAVVETQEVTIAELVHSAARGDKNAWDELVLRFSPLVLSVAGRYRLGEQDGADVSQTVWLRLVQHLATLREPAALPGWIVTTTRNECLRVLRIRQRMAYFDPLIDPPGGGRGAAGQDDIDDNLMQDERHEALLSAFAELPARHRELLILLLTDPPVSYAEISERLGIPIGGIGPTRARALDRLRRSPALAALLKAESQP
jgi:RNA polymerase sigma factor (sigma-70 family)